MKTQINLKNFLLITAILFFVLSQVFSKTSSPAGDDNTLISVPTIVCGSCVKRVTKALEKIDGVTDVKVDLDTKTAAVKFDNSKTTISDLENAITAAGYDANDKKANPVAYEKLDDCCKAK